MDIENVPEQIVEIYKNYAAQIEGIRSNYKQYISLFGLGNSPSKHPCHMEFLRSLEQVSKELVSQSLSPEAAQAALAYICYPSKERNVPSYAEIVYDTAHGQALSLVSALTPESAARILNEYELHYPKKQRLPNQQKLCVELKKRAARD